MNDDVIAAIATGYVESAIGIVRVSGNGSLGILKNIFHPKKDFFEANHIYYGFIKNNDQIIDEVLVSTFKAPRSYTGEDLIEINCHGGLLIMKKILNLVLENGARIAHPGEFSKRAFLNNKIDLIQANAIVNLIKAKTDKALEIAFNQLLKKNTILIEELREKIIFLMAENEVNIDHPDEPLSNYNQKKRLKMIEDVKDKIKKLLVYSKKGKYLSEGAKVAIIGKPNVGKSSILNTLLGEDRAIVTNIPGTTTDIISESININGIPVKIHDTAGIREHSSKIELIGIQKSKEIIDSADVLIAVFDSSDTYSYQDELLCNLIKNKKNVIIVLNKIDIKSNFSKTFKFPTVRLSCMSKIGFDDLRNLIYTVLIENCTDEQIISLNISQTAALETALKQANKIRLNINKNLDPALIGIDLQVLADYIEQIIGKIENEDILENIFKNFCVGK